jgi:hypothetical protein
MNFAHPLGGSAVVPYGKAFRLHGGFPHRLWRLPLGEDRAASLPSMRMGISHPSSP